MSSNPFSNRTTSEGSSWTKGRNQSDLIVNWLYLAIIAIIGLTVITNELDRFRMDSYYYRAIQDIEDVNEIENKEERHRLEQLQEFKGVSKSQFYLKYLSVPVISILIGIFFPLMMAILRLRDHSKKAYLIPYYFSMVVFVGFAVYTFFIR